jgi:hypothetical protein
MNTLKIYSQENPCEENIEVSEANNAPIYSLDEGLRIARILQYPIKLKHPTLVALSNPMIIYHETEFVEYLNNSLISHSTPLLLEPLNGNALSEGSNDFAKRKEIIKQHCRKIALEIAKLD